LTEKPYRRDNLICVAVVAGQMTAQVFKSKLEAAGIPVLLHYDSASVVLGLTVDGLGQVRIMVPEDLAEDALAIIQPEPLGDDEEGLEACSDSDDVDES
jgi:hypothetical protein